MSDLNTLKRPLSIRFNKKNAIHPFEDPSSLEFFADKNDASLMVFGSNSKKRPLAMTFVRCFEHKILDMMELLVVPETLRTLSQFKNAKKPTVGLKPLICFSGSPFESPVSTNYTRAKSMLLDFFKGPDAKVVDVEGLQYMVCISAADEVDGKPPPMIQLRCYLIKTRKSGARLPRVEVEEMGPRVDFRIGRVREADPDVMKEALKRPKGTAVSLSARRLGSHSIVLIAKQPKTKKNIETDIMGDKVGRIHVGKQNLQNLQTRKMKGLKRGRDVDVATNGDDDIVFDDEPATNGDAKRSRV